MASGQKTSSSLLDSIPCPAPPTLRRQSIAHRCLSISRACPGTRLLRQTRLERLISARAVGVSQHWSPSPNAPQNRNAHLRTKGRMPRRALQACPVGALSITQQSSWTRDESTPSASETDTSIEMHVAALGRGLFWPDEAVRADGNVVAHLSQRVRECVPIRLPAHTHAPHAYTPRQASLN